MTRSELEKQLSATIGKTKVNKLTVILTEQRFALCDIIDLTFHPDKTIAFRAAWLLENVFLKNPESYLPELDYLLSRFNEVIYPSCQRHYAKIIMHITSAKAPVSIQAKLLEANLQPVVEKCFDWMIDPEILIAVKVHASEALFNLRLRYPWIKDELTEQLEFLMRDGTAAIQTRGRKLLNGLKTLL